MLKLIRQSQFGVRERVIDAAFNVLVRARTARLDLRSRRGEGGMIWTILTISLVAAVAAVSLYVFGPKIMTMGTQAADKLQSPPW